MKLKEGRTSSDSLYVGDWRFDIVQALWVARGLVSCLPLLISLELQCGDDHDPPHFLVRYQQFRARVRIEDGAVIDGRLPPTVTRLVAEWTALRRDALMRNWHAARTDGQLERIEGLE